MRRLRHHLRELAEARGLTSAPRIAGACHVSISTVVPMLLDPHRLPSGRVVEQICNGLECELDELLELVEEPAASAKGNGTRSKAGRAA